MTEIIFEVSEAAEGGFDARALGHSIFTQGEDWDDLKVMARDAVLCHFEEEDAPRVILHLVRPEGTSSILRRERPILIGGAYVQDRDHFRSQRG